MEKYSNVSCADFSSFQHLLSIGLLLWIHDQTEEFGWKGEVRAGKSWGLHIYFLCKQGSHGQPNQSIEPASQENLQKIVHVKSMYNVQIWNYWLMQHVISPKVTDAVWNRNCLGIAVASGMAPTENRRSCLHITLQCLQYLPFPPLSSNNAELAWRNTEVGTCFLNYLWVFSTGIPFIYLQIRKLGIISQNDYVSLAQ